MPLVGQRIEILRIRPAAHQNLRGGQLRQAKQRRPAWQKTISSKNPTQIHSHYRSLIIAGCENFSRANCSPSLAVPHPAKNPSTPRENRFSRDARASRVPNPPRANWHRRRLHRTLDQQAQFVPPLRRARDFFAVPEQIEFFMAGETLARQGFFAARRKFRFDFQFRERQPQPVVDAPVTFLGLERMPFVAGRKNGAVSPVRVMRHDAAAGRTPDERTQLRGALDLGKFLEIAERRRRLRPAVKTQHRLAAGAAWLPAAPRPAPC